jgi:hypothetical protein
MRFLGFPDHEKGALKQEISKWSTMCKTFSRSGWSFVRSASLAKGGTSKKRPSPHIHEVPTRSNKVGPRTLQKALVFWNESQEYFRLPTNILYSSDTGKKWEYNGTVHQICGDFKNSYNSFRRQVLHNTLTEFVINMKLIRLIINCLNKIYSKVRIGKNLSDEFPIQDVLKQGDPLLPGPFKFTLE